MSREAALTARLGLDDSDIRRKIDAQSGNYNKLLAANEAYQKKLASQNAAARRAELAAEKADYEKRSAQNRSSTFTQSGGGPVTARADLERIMQAEQRAAVLARSQSAVKGSVGSLKLRDDVGAGSGNFMDPAFINRTKVSIDGLTRSTLTANTAMNKGRGASTNAGMGMLFLAQGIDDAQYGFRSIVNNIAPLVMALGGGPGLAGIMTIAAVGFNLLGDAASKAWENMKGTESYNLVLKQNAELEEIHRRRIALLQIETQQRAEFHAEGRAQVEATEDRLRSAQEAEFQRTERGIALAEQLAQARLAGLTPLERAAAINAREAKANEARLKRELQMYEDRLHNEASELKASEDRLAALKDEQRALARKPEDTLSEADKRRQIELGEEIPSLQSKVDGRRARRDQDRANRDRVKGEQKNLPAENALRDQELAMETAKKGINTVVNFFTDMHDRAKAANDLDEKLWSKRQKEAAQQSHREELMGRLREQELRAKGKNKQANAIEKETRIAELMSGPDQYTAAQANDIATREAALRDPRKQRSIHGARSRNLKTGLDGEFHSGATDFKGFQDMSQDYFGIREATTQKRTQQNARLQKVNEGLNKAESSGDKATVNELRTLKTAIIAKLEELNQSTKGTAGEQIKPANQ